jgi:hypothetical protein
MHGIRRNFTELHKISQSKSHSYCTLQLEESIHKLAPLKIGRTNTTCPLPIFFILFPAENTLMFKKRNIVSETKYQNCPTRQSANIINKLYFFNFHARKSLKTLNSAQRTFMIFNKRYRHRYLKDEKINSKYNYNIARACR